MSARQKAERCFNLARSTSFASERETAIARGVAIAERAGIDLNEFDIPGRTRTFTAPRFGHHPAPKDYSVADILKMKAAFDAHMYGSNDAMQSLDEALRRREAEVGTRDGETVYDARRRNFHEASAKARARDAARA